MEWILVDKILECDPGKSIVAVKTFARSEQMFQDHFPGYPIVPGVIQIEMIAHAGSRCLALSDKVNLAILGSIRSAKFYKSIEPDQICRIKAVITSVRTSYAVASGEIEVNGARVCSAEMIFALIPRTLLTPGHEDAVLADWHARQGETKP